MLLHNNGLSTAPDVLHGRHMPPDLANGPSRIRCGGLDACSGPSDPSGDAICVLKASYGSCLWVGESMKMSDFESAISCMGIREGVLGITAEVIWRSEAAGKPSYGAVKMLTMLT